MAAAAARWRGAGRADASGAPGEAPSPTVARQPRRRGSWIPVWKLPSPLVSAVLVSVFLGFGTLLGAAAGSPAGGAAAANAGAHLKLMLPPARTSTGTAPIAPSRGSESGSSGEPPPAETETTPTAPTISTTTATTPAASENEPAASGEGSESSTGAAATKLPAIKHVFLITLSNEPYATVFGPASTARYLTGTLEKRGELLVRYDAVAHEELANGVALLSGQGPTVETAANCATYTDIAPATVGASGQVQGSGCVYPRSTQTLPGQLQAKHLTWRAYVQGMDEPGAQAGACAHPVLGQADPTAVQTAGTGPYATFRNPFVYFHAITDSAACASADVGLDRLKVDLASSAHTPSFVYVAPDRCHDGNPTPCTPGAPAGMGPADAFLAKVVPEITASKAYHDGGLLVITVDEAPSSGEFADSSSCCGQPAFPNIPAPAGGRSARGGGGGAVGALLISRYVKGAATSQEVFNHFSLLRTIEDLFGLKHLGYAGLPAVKSLPPSLFTAKPSG